MILRRLSEHVKSQNWFAVSLDFLIVVFGVYIGLQVQEWSQAQNDRKREQQIIADMLADLEIDRREYSNGMALALRRAGAANASLVGSGLTPIEFEWVMPNTDSVDYSFDTSNSPELTTEQYDMLWTDVILGFFPTPSTSTYDAMIGAGDIRILKNRELVREIQLYRNRVGSVIMQNEKQMLIRANSLSVGAAYGLAPYTRKPVEDYFRLVAGEPEIAATIRVQGTFAIFHHGEIKSADLRATELQGRLASFLDAAQ